MKLSILLTATLVLSGLSAVIVGAGMLFAPTAFHATAGIELTGGTNLLNEMRAAGGAVLAIGALIFAGAFAKRLSGFAIVLATIVYMSYGFSRLFSLFVDGFPSVALMQITAFEIAIGFVCLAVGLRSRKSAKRRTSVTQ